jgi:ribosomal protein L11 methyltransferase
VISGHLHFYFLAFPLNIHLMPPRLWYAVDISLETAAQEAVEYALMEIGANGTESSEAGDDLMTATGYFDAPPDQGDLRYALNEALLLYNLEPSAVRGFSQREVADQDWLGEWKKGWQPVSVGKRFVVAPPWSIIPPALDRLVIQIEPGMAFGTGTHETTRLCLTAIEEYYEGGSFLDVGTGTGILAIAAARLFPRATIDALDTDEEAISIARENAELNDCPQIRFHTGSVDATTSSADCVVANLTADVIIPLLPQLVGIYCNRLILSGILATQEEQVRLALHANSVDQICEVLTDGEWIAIVV